MDKKLIRILNTSKIWHYDNAGIQYNGIHFDISGDVSGISGDVSDIWGDVSNISGNVSGISGNVSGISGDLDDCNISKNERDKGIRIDFLIRKSIGE